MSAHVCVCVCGCMCFAYFRTNVCICTRVWVVNHLNTKEATRTCSIPVKLLNNNDTIVYHFNFPNTPQSSLRTIGNYLKSNYSYTSLLPVVSRFIKKSIYTLALSSLLHNVVLIFTLALFNLLHNVVLIFTLALFNLLHNVVLIFTLALFNLLHNVVLIFTLALFNLLHNVVLGEVITLKIV